MTNRGEPHTSGIHENIPYLVVQMFDRVMDFRNLTENYAYLRKDLQVFALSRPRPCILLYM